MAVDPQQKLEALNSELQQIVDNYNKATQVAENCKQKISGANYFSNDHGAKIKVLLLSDWAIH